jgi:hypothetical protein
MCLASLSFAQAQNQTSIVIDGALSEVAWSIAEEINSFSVTTPFSLNKPPRQTIVRTFSDEAGIYIAFTNYQPISEGVAARTLRDEEIQADFNEIIIDFDASGDRAFGFKVSRKNSIQDSVWTNQNRENLDWDGRWQYAVQEYSDHWTSEVFIP